MSGPARDHRFEQALFRVLRGAWSLVPEAVAVRLAALLGVWIADVVRLRRRDVDAHLAQAFPDRDARWRARVARGAYVHLAREAVVLFRLGGWSVRRVLGRTRMVGFEHMLEAASAGKGVVLLTGHLGNWEMGGAAIAARGVPLTVVGKGMANERFHDELFAMRERLGMEVVEMADAARSVPRALAEGRVVALLADQNAHRGGVFVPFFGRPASTVRGPAVFAARSGAPVFVAFAVRDPGWGQRYTVTFRPLSFAPSGDAEADSEALMLDYNRVLEEAVKSFPDQYFWHHRRWKKRPSEEQASDAAVTTP